jgi:hypothetical protein
VIRLLRAGLAATAVACGSAGAVTEPTTTEHALAELRANRCGAGIAVLNRGVAAGEPDAYSLIGHLMAKGLCVPRDPQKAIKVYLEPAAKAGQIDAAYLLVALHGFGIGVPQSYAQAGRWSLAVDDIAALKAGKPQDSAAGPLDPAATEARGVVATALATVRDRLMYPPRDVRPRPTSADVLLTLRLGADGFRYSLGRERAQIDADLQSPAARRPEGAAQVAVAAVVDQVLKELPPHKRPDTPQRLEAPIVFQMP